MALQEIRFFLHQAIIKADNCHTPLDAMYVTTDDDFNKDTTRTRNHGRHAHDFNAPNADKQLPNSWCSLKLKDFRSQTKTRRSTLDITINTFGKKRTENGKHATRHTSFRDIRCLLRYDQLRYPTALLLSF